LMVDNNKITNHGEIKVTSSVSSSLACRGVALVRTLGCLLASARLRMRTCRALDLLASCLLV